MPNDLVETWRHVIVGDEKSWVLFKNGTCVVLIKSEQDLAQDAIELMKKEGPVVVGTSAGDFLPVELEDYPGWLVTYDHPDVMNYVSPDEIEDAQSNLPADLVAGLIGRSKRKQDAEDLTIIHIEDKSKGSTG